MLPHEIIFSLESRIKRLPSSTTRDRLMRRLNSAHISAEMSELHFNPLSRQTFFDDVCDIDFELALAEESARIAKSDRHYLSETLQALEDLS